MENIVSKEIIARFVQFFFCHYVFKKPTAGDASESVYMRERVKTVRSGDTCKDELVVVI